jgi:2-hydroxychromene-2-carboxylate isomerase
MVTADWYFDYVSPFAYLQFRRFSKLPDSLRIRYTPVLFAGLLKHFGHKGPAEIPLKRIHTYRFCRWYAERHEIPFRMPPAHPFNPLPLLRETIRLDCPPLLIEAMFRGIFEQGMLPGDERFWRWCSKQSGYDLAPRESFDEAVKRRLQDNTLRAIEAGVYGVPSFELDGEVFWGDDCTDMFIEFLNGRLRFDDAESLRLVNLPIEQARRT